MRDTWYQQDFNLLYEFDSLGHRKTIRYPLLLPIYLMPDALGRPTRVGNYVSQVEYAANGRPSHFVYGNGIEFDEQQNVRGLPWKVEYTKGAMVYADRTLTYDRNGNILSINDADPGGPGLAPVGLTPQSTDDRSFTYDVLDRLTGLTSSWIAPGGYPGYADDQYDYDPLGNLRHRRTQRLNAQGGVDMRNAWLYYDTRNTLHTVSSVDNPLDPRAYTYTFDPRGNLVNEHRPPITNPPRGIVDFELDFNLSNQMVGDVYGSKFAYDARGWRFMKHVYLGENVPPVQGLRQTFVHDASGLLRQSTKSGNDPTRYYYLGDKPIARTDGNYETPTYIHPNYQNSPLFETDMQGTVTRSLTFYAYGQPSCASELYGPDVCDQATMMPLGMPGLAADTAITGGDWLVPELEYAPGYAGSYPERETSLLYMGARYQHGPRFISAAPAPLNPLHPAGLNRYAYANNNPVRFTDPTGRQVFIPNPSDPSSIARVNNVLGQAKATQVTQRYSYTPTRSEVATALDGLSVAATGLL